jgi:hypothetical protein
MRLAILLGSGASRRAGMPDVREITEQVLSGHNVLCSGNDFRVLGGLPPNAEMFNQPLAVALAFVRDVKRLCDDYFASQEKDRVTNYEDIAYVARQIDDGITSEYENPALLPFNERYTAEHGLGLGELQEAAATTADYIEDMVRAMVGRPFGQIDYLSPLVAAFNDSSVGQLDVATLNHDLVLETALRTANVRYSDGFDRRHGTLALWTDRYPEPSRRLFKLHGSVDWFRYYLTLNDWGGQISARSTGDPFHATGPAGERLEYPAGGRPLILTGTFNKILSYPTGVYADQHFRFHEALRGADHLLVIGYGFRDKAINARVIAWAERPGRRRMVVVHPDPSRIGQQARGAIRGKWRAWQERGLLGFVPKYLGGDVTWEELRLKLEAE